MKTWHVQHSIRRRELLTDPDTLPGDWHPVLRRVFAARGVTCAGDLDASLQRLHRPDALSGISRACELLGQAVTDHQRIVVVGDFDADGATGTALALRALRSMGATDTHYVVPNRMTHGYGLSQGLVESALQPLKPDLVVTVDNGIASLRGVAAARAAGIQVIVTDHHLPGAELPQAGAIVNPNLPGDPFPSKTLAGVGVMFYVMAALRGHLEQAGWFQRNGLRAPRIADWLDLVALGTVADLVPLDWHNRVLVAQGLKRMRAGRACVGILALAQVSGRDVAQLVTQDCGFALAPRLNAAGRLDDMSLGIECLLTDDPAKARELAATLDGINRERYRLQQTMQTQAQSALDEVEERLDLKQLPWGVTLYDAGWHPGIVGLVASRVKDQLHRPVIAFAPSAPGSDTLKGSARSVPALHIRDTLANLEARDPELMPQFGGHAMAAGLSLPLLNLDRFQQAFDKEVRRMLAQEDLEGVIFTDGELHAADYSLPFAYVLRNAAPWGQAFPRPRFDGVFKLRGCRTVGQRHLEMRLQAPKGGPLLRAISFNTPAQAVPEGTRRVRLAYELDVNRYQGTESVQLRVEYLEPV